MRGISISRAMHHYLCEKTVSVLFGKIAAKRTKNGVMRGSAGCLLDAEFRRNSASGGVTYA